MMAQKVNIDPKRTYIMSRVKQKDTRIEVLLCSRLHKLGFRFRKNYKKLPGSPDIVLPKYKVALFVHGCFWHGHDGCRKGRRPKTRTDYWLPKIEDNKERDLKKIGEIDRLGWRVAVIWQCSLDSEVESTTRRLTNWIKTRDTEFRIVEF
jgi:DNA mismatch endonuclease (patch repair protein)